MTALAFDCTYRTPTCTTRLTIDSQRMLKFWDEISRALAAALNDAVGVYQPPPWMTTELPHRLAGILALEDGWDSYDGRAPSPKVGESVIQLLGRVASDQMPSIEANPSGMAIVEWESGDDFVAVSVADHELLVEYEIDGVDKEFELFGNADMDRLRDLIGSLG